MTLSQAKLTALAAACVLASAACGSQSAASSPSPQPIAQLKGVAFSPPAGTQGVTSFFKDLPALGGSTSWSGDWAELATPNSSAYQLSALAAAQNAQLIIIVTAHKNSSPVALLRPLDGPTQSTYLNELDAYFGKYQPAYFGIGIEVNNLYEVDLTGYRTFAALFATAAAKIHHLSPSTRVFVVFQLEKMKGLSQGLLANSKAPASGEWQLLSDFPSADLFAFTSYPFLVYHDPAQIPSGYYLDIANHTSKPIAISELGWPSAPVAAGWSSSPQLQAQFVTRFQTLVVGMAMPFVLWLSAYDQNTPAPFSNIGLALANGTKKPAWSVWAAATF